MAVQSVAVATQYSDDFLRSVGADRKYVAEFWRKHTPQGRLQSMSYGLILVDPVEYVSAILDCQRFVFSDAGDRLLGLPEREATDEETDGLLGPMTWRRMEAWNDSQEPIEFPETVVWVDHGTFAGAPLYVPSTGIVTPDEPNGLDLPTAATKKHGKLKGFSLWPKPIDDLIASSKKFATILGFIHWDVCSSSAMCFRTLRNLGLGSSMGIDGDGTVWWWADPGTFYGWHGVEANRKAVSSYDLQNPVSLKYAKSQYERWGVERPVLHMDRYEHFGKGKGYLGMYEKQIVSLLRVLKALSVRTGLPLEFPTKVLSTGNTGRPFGRNVPWLFKGSFHGVATHRHLPDTTKWDVRGLEYQIIVLLQELPQYAEEFPELVECFRIHDPWAREVNDNFRATCRWPELGIGEQHG